LFPGGFGTHDEGFEVLTLLQTGKTPPMPVVLMETHGDQYWETWDGFVRTQLLKRGFISREDLSFYTIVHSPEEAVESVRSYYSTYHSMRQVRDNLVIRMEKELSDYAMQALSRSFHDIVQKGEIMRSGPLTEESDEPGLLSKPRMVFVNSRKSAGRLNQMVLAINQLGQSEKADMGQFELTS
jgi:hypothetical protein